MRKLYPENTANYPRLKTDVFFADHDNKYRYDGFMDSTIRHIQQTQLLEPALWARFVKQFTVQSDGTDKGWRGEFWGKTMRGAALTYAYTRDPALYDTLTQTVEAILNTAEENGRISSYTQESELNGWDLWCRKYVLLGLQYYLEICRDDSLAGRIIACMCRQVDYIMDRVGPKTEGKLPIGKTSHIYRGANSSSILEPVVRLYSLTKNERYLDFATYLVEAGGLDIANIFRLAYENNFKPYQYPITKAYETISCFEGLLEYYRVTGTHWHKTAVVNFADAILETDFTVVGSCGCSFEFFDHSAVRQANTNVEFAQETCVTVTLMKFLFQVNLLTGDPKYVDAFERSLYNAYFGAFNTEKIVSAQMLTAYPEAVPEPLPFDSYSPLTAGIRGTRVGGLQKMQDDHCYGCCACIGAAGNGLVPKLHLVTSEDGFAMNLYISGKVVTSTGHATVTFVTQTAYPADGTVKITVQPEQEEQFTLRLRNPRWSEHTSLSVNGEDIAVSSGYICIDRLWKRGDTVVLQLDMRTRAVYPIPYGNQILMNKALWLDNYMVSTFDVEDPRARDHIALCRGPITLAQDSRLGYDLETPVRISVNPDGTVDTALQSTVPFPHLLEVSVPLTNGKSMKLIDYASAGKLWSEESKLAAWILTE